MNNNLNYWVAPDLKIKKDIETVLKELCIDLEIELGKLKSKSRLREIADKRHIALYVLYKNLGLTTLRSGKLLNRDHASVIHAVRKVENLSLCGGGFDKYKMVTITDERQIKNKY